MIKPTNKEPLQTLDVPTAMFMGAALGFLIVGVLLGTIGVLFEAPKGQIWDWSTLFGALADIGISAIIGLVALLYWWLVPRRSGVACPRLSGFGLLTTLLSLFSGAILGVIIGCRTIF